MIVIERAVRVLGVFPEMKYHLPPGYPFLVDDDDTTVLEAPLLYMTDRFPPNGKIVENTLEAVAFDIRKFVQSCQNAEKSLLTVDSEFLVAYRDERLKTISNQTHNVRDPGNEHRGFNRIYDLFCWAVGNGALDKNPFDDFLKDEQSDAFTSDGTKIRRSPIEAFHKPVAKEQDVRAMRRDEWAAIKANITSQQNGSTRDAYASELGVASGLRVDEVAHLEAWQIENLVVTDEMGPAEIIRLPLLWTKGGRPRKVELSAELVRDLKAYIKGERARCIELSQRYKASPDIADTLALFVNREDSGRNVGGKTVADTLAEGFRKAVIACGFFNKVKKCDPSTGLEYLTLLPKYSFHCLRHTFAVWYYFGNLTTGNPFPWKDLQTLLGHKFLSTTINIYLHAVDGTRKEINAKVFRAVRNKYNGDKKTTKPD